MAQDTKPLQFKFAPSGDKLFSEIWGFEGLGKHKLEQYLPWFFDDVKDSQMLMRCQDPEIYAIQQSINDVANSFFIKTAEDKRLKQWEDILFLSKLPNDTYYRRRMRILIRIWTKPPLTYRWLDNLLLNTFGEGGFKTTVDYNNYLLEISVLETDEYLIRDIAQFLRGMIPANLTLTFTILGTFQFSDDADPTVEEFDDTKGFGSLTDDAVGGYFAGTFVWETLKMEAEHILTKDIKTLTKKETDILDAYSETTQYQDLIKGEIAKNGQ